MKQTCHVSTSAPARGPDLADLHRDGRRGERQGWTWPILAKMLLALVVSACHPPAQLPVPVSPDCGVGWSEIDAGCLDVDECADGTHDCAEFATCTNTEGGFECACLTGFEGDGQTCVDVDECTLRLDNCADDARCENTDGGFECQCNPGFDGNGVTCTDVDECALGVHGCDPYARCENRPGTFECVCQAGFRTDGQTCEDLDECALRLDNCADTAQCQNLPGGFACTCNEGYAGDGVTCTDLDECATLADNCHADAVCANTPGGFTCTCPDGFAGDGRFCDDVDECDQGTHTCPPAAICTNTWGGYDCLCDVGFGGDGRRCDDVDECADGLDDCHENARCRNVWGGFECACSPGYVGDGNHCTDVDECAAGIDDCSPMADCLNTPGGFTCDCRAGFVEEGRHCVDVDECAAGLDDCAEQAQCRNTPGGFTCTCEAGYAGDGRACVNVDECALRTDNCADVAQCVDTQGSFECVCPAGFVGDGLRCDDVDECDAGIDDCHPNARCLDVDGAFRCACVDGFRGDGIHCTDVDECALGLHDCNEHASCRNTAGAFECTCLGGYTGDGRRCDDVNECAGEHPTTQVRTTLVVSVADGIGAPFDPATPEATSDAIGHTQLVDGRGHANPLSMYARRTAAEAWAIHLILEADALADAPPNRSTHIVLGALSFDGEGRLQTANLASPVTFEWVDGPATVVDFHFGTPLDEGGDGLDGSVRSGDAINSRFETVMGDGVALNGGCALDAVCVNVAGDRRCECRPGYRGDGEECVNIDECTEGTDNCADDGICTDTLGSFECACPPVGYRGDGVTCTEIDECAEGLDDCPLNAVCHNTAGAFRCECNPGYGGPDGACDELDECALGTDDCAEDAECTNVVASFQCACLPGFVGDGVRCDDIDECARDVDDCDPRAQCINTPGDFQCRCLPGEIGDGRVCTSLEWVTDVLSSPESGCAGCHADVFPNLSDVTHLIALPSRQSPLSLIEPGDHQQSYLYHKLAGTHRAPPADGAGETMPLERRSLDAPSLARLALWIDSLRTAESMPDAPVRDVLPSPNTLDQEALFTCNDVPTSSPPRLRRLERRELTYSMSQSVSSAVIRGATAAQNPLFAPPSAQYSTFLDAVSVDPDTLGASVMALTSGVNFWSIAGTNYVIRWFNERHRYPFDVMTFLNPNLTTDESVEGYVRALLEYGVLFRTPTELEVESLLAFAHQALEREQAAGNVDASRRLETTVEIIAAARLTTEALFRDEVGDQSAVEGGRAPLDAAALGQALAYTLDDRAPGVSSNRLLDENRQLSFSAPVEGYLSGVRAAVDDGSIHDPATLRGLVRAYSAGVDDDRVDLSMDFTVAFRQARSRYWVSKKIRRFFREWLQYRSADLAFKADPWATSVQGNAPPAVTFAALQGPPGSTYLHLKEPNFVHQLDETIARVIVEDREVLARLLTSPRFYVHASVNEAWDATMRRNLAHVPKAYGIENEIQPTREDRWRDLPEGTRAGVLTHPAWLIAHGAEVEDGASLVRRGRWIRENLLCEDVPGHETTQIIPQLVPSDPEHSARARVRLSMDGNPECMACHRLTDSLGTAFEIYNHAGLLRVEDHGGPPDGSSVLEDLPDPALNGPVVDATDLVNRLAASDHVKRCFVRQTFRAFMGRNERLADACTLAAMEAAYDGHDGSFVAMLEALVTSGTFRYRSVEEDQE